MSIRINKDKCVSCGKCREICPGNLIKADEKKKAYVKFPNKCWGCASCLKECRAKAIQYYLGADIGGTGVTMIAETNGNITDWIIGDKVIKVDKNNANAY